jgi:hypothetical protein
MRLVETIQGMGGWEIKESDREVNSTMMYCKKCYKYHCSQYKKKKRISRKNNSSISCGALAKRAESHTITSKWALQSDTPRFKFFLLHL